MHKHLSFWLGVFISLIVFVPIAFGIIGASEEKLLNQSVFFFGFICALLLSLVILLFLRDRVVTKIFGTTISTIDEIAENAHSLAKSILAKEPESIQHKSRVKSQLTILGAACTDGLWELRWRCSSVLPDSQVRCFYLSKIKN